MCIVLVLAQLSLHLAKAPEVPPHITWLSHSRWHYKYHVVFVPKKRRSVLYGRIRQALGPIFHALARQKECRIVEGHICKDHVHMCIEIPPKYAVSSTIGFIKGKSAIAIARQFNGKDRNFSGEHFWARGYAVSTVGFDEEDVRKYIQDQDPSGGNEGAF